MGDGVRRKGKEIREKLREDSKRKKKEQYKGR